MALLLGLASSLSGCAVGAGGEQGPAAWHSPAPTADAELTDARQRARIRLELASAYFERGQTAVALEEIQRALASDPAYGPAHVLRGLVHMRLDEPARAQDSFHRALLIDPRDADALHNLGWLQCQQGHYTDALALFERALRSPLYEGSAKTLMAEGICLMRMDRWQEAEDRLAKAHELDAVHPVIGYNLAVLLYKRGDYSRAQLHVHRLNRSAMANAETLWLGIRVERRLNQTDAMEQLALQLSRHFPASRQWAAYQRGAFDE
ncbi:MAG: type IV pilus biogenesis/stability protein PilW [Hydrogenophaga sp.]